jgi:hypothetical protein
MDLILELRDLNFLFEKYINADNEYFVWSEAHDPSISYERHISTRCITTAAAFRYLISQDDKWNIVDTLTCPIYQVSIHGMLDDVENGDYPMHCFIVYDNNNIQEVYQSFYGKYPIRKTIFNNLRELLDNVIFHWKEITEDNSPFVHAIKVVYHEPKNWTEDEILYIQERYNLLI